MSAKKVRKERTVHRRPWMLPYPIEHSVTVQEGGEGAKEVEMDWETRLRIRRERMSWADWVRYDMLRYWYWLLALSAVAFELLQISWTHHVRDGLGLSALALLGFAQVVIVFYIYRLLWPEGGLTEGQPANVRLRKAYRRLRLRLRWRL